MGGRGHKVRMNTFQRFVHNASNGPTFCAQLPFIFSPPPLPESRISLHSSPTVWKFIFPVYTSSLFSQSTKSMDLTKKYRSVYSPTMTGGGRWDEHPEYQHEVLASAVEK